MSVKQYGSVSYSVRAAVAATLGTVVMMGFAPQAARAQDAVVKPDAAKGAAELQEVVVTGSRILRKDMVSNSPLVTVDSSALESQSGLNVESYLNQLPNFNPSAAPTIQTGSS